MPTMLRLVCLVGLLFLAFCGKALGKAPQVSDTAPAAKPSVLITGGAGFIGSHLAKSLQESGLAQVVVVDNFNTYYNPALKWQRVQSLLLPAGVRVIEGDVCNDTLISSLMEEYSFQAVYHLAAQAGVRYSLKKPQAYVRENVQCFVALLEQIRAVGESGRPAPKLLYASSSSVYGLSERIPFTETDRVDKLSNLYGATKRMNENTAFAYHNLFNITSIGFRFFTVYGPWGRPDMAAYLFSDNILRGAPITVFNEGKLLRDFTYIDDIVSGLVSALSVSPATPLVLNLGNNKPVEVLRFITLLEGLLGKTANKRFAVSRAEMPITFANISLAQQLLGYQPKVSIETGLAAFVQWYKTYEREATPCESECVVLPDMCFPSGWQTAAAASRAHTQDCHVVVYSLSLGMAASTTAGPAFVPWLVRSSTRPTLQVCAVVFVSPTAPSPPPPPVSSPHHRRLSVQWKTIEVSGLADHPAPHRLVRVLTLTPGRFFAPTVHTAVYIHPKLELRMPIHKLVDLLAHPRPEPAGLGKVSMLVVRNDQARKDGSLSRGNASGEAVLVQRQVHAYERYAVDAGVCFQQFFFEDALIVHDLHAPGAQRLRCDWYREFAMWSEHDQMAGAFALARAATAAGGKALCAQLEASRGHTTEEEVLVPITSAGKKSAGGAEAAAVEYVRMLPNKLYHWHFTENLAKETR